MTGASLRATPARARGVTSDPGVAGSPAAWKSVTVAQLKRAINTVYFQT